MRPLVTAWFALLSCSAYALPFQTPVAGNYQCFSSEESMLDVNAVNIGATLTINADGSYTFTTSNASENGSVQTQEDTSQDLSSFFQSGSFVTLQPSNSSSSYNGMFVTDKKGGMYVIIKNNNGLNIRCQSPGANIASVFEQAATEQPQTSSETETGTTENSSTNSAEDLTPLQAVQSGRYECTFNLNHQFFASNQDPNDLYFDEEPDLFDVLIYDDGSTLTIDTGHLNRDTYDGTYWKNDDGTLTVYGHKDIYVSQYAQGSYTFDASASTISFAKGRWNGLTFLYGTNADGVPALSYIYVWRENPDTTDDEYTATTSCTRIDDLPPSEMFALANSTPKVDLFNVTIAASKNDSSIDPSKEPIVDTYYCYPIYEGVDYDSNDDFLPSFERYLREHRLEILPNHEYLFDGEGGAFVTSEDYSYIQWQNGPLNPTGDTSKGDYAFDPPYSGDLGFTNWGEEITDVSLPGSENIDCYQQGAREQKALLDAALRQPTPATYVCSYTTYDDMANAEVTNHTLEFLPNNRYRFDTKVGSYSTAINDQVTVGDIFWESGPLSSLSGTTNYYADDARGLRNLSYEYSTVLMGGGLPAGSATVATMGCEAVVQANLIPRYGTALAPPPPAGSGGLEGFYLLAEEKDVATAYHFLADGHVLMNSYAMGDECSKTYPNGRPVCQTYSLQKNVVTFNDGTSVTLAQAEQGDILLDEVRYENKTLNGPQTLAGTFEYSDASSSSPIINMSSTFVYEGSYSFTENGSFSFYSSSRSTMAAPGLGSDVGALGTSSSSVSDSGSYTIDGNVITFTSEKGYTEQCVFFFSARGVNICGRDYGTP